MTLINGNEFVSVFLTAPKAVLKERYIKRAAFKDLSLSFEDAIKRDSLLGLEELITYLYKTNTRHINYSHYEIDNTLQEK